jgi:hypothetical protein
MSSWFLKKQKLTTYLFSIILLSLFNFATCKYSFKDTSPIPIEVKTFRVNYLENKAGYVNPQLSPQLTEKVKQKIINTTRLTQINDEAHYDISGYFTQYSTSTISISGSNSSGNRLTVGFHLIFKNTLDEKKDLEADLIRSYDFDANLSLTQAEAELTNDIVKSLADDIFNKIFSNW